MESYIYNDVIRLDNVLKTVEFSLKMGQTYRLNLKTDDCDPRMSSLRAGHVFFSIIINNFTYVYNSVLPETKDYPVLNL